MTLLYQFIPTFSPKTYSNFLKIVFKVSLAKSIIKDTLNGWDCWIFLQPRVKGCLELAGVRTPDP